MGLGRLEEGTTVERQIYSQFKKFKKKQIHDFYKERGLEVPKPGMFGCVLLCIDGLKR